MIPQASRIIIPPLTSQYLNLTKNSSLAVAIGYPDFVSVFTGTVLNQTGQAVEVILMTMGVFLTLSLAHVAVHELVQPPHGAGGEVARWPMPAATAVRPPPGAAGGPIAWLRANLFSSWSNTLLTLLALWLVYQLVTAVVGWAFAQCHLGGARTASACAREGAGACWPFVAAWFGQFMYGRYPEAERWRVNLTYVLALAGLVPLMVPRIPGKLWSSIYLLAVFPVLAIILLSGGVLGLEPRADRPLGRPAGDAGDLQRRHRRRLPDRHPAGAGATLAHADRALDVGRASSSSCAACR